MIYLDHASTSLPRHPAALAAAIEGASWATPSRGLHAKTIAASSRVDAARASIHNRVGADSSAIVCWTAGATAALNQAILGLRRPIRAIAIDPLLHNAAYRPAMKRCGRTWRLPCDASTPGSIDVARARREWNHETDLVVLTHASNVTGHVQPIADVVALAHEHNAIVVVDAAQTFGAIHGPIEGDLIALSAHKALRALPGVGALVVHSRVADMMDPLVVGGTGFDSTSIDMPSELPARVEAGTPNLPGIAAMAAAVPLSAGEWRDCAGALREAVARAEIDRAIGGNDLPIVSVSFEGIDPQQVAELLDRSFSIACRAGLHCAPLAHETIGTLERGGTVRISASPSVTTSADLETLTLALRACKKLGVPGAPGAPGAPPAS